MNPSEKVPTDIRQNLADLGFPKDKRTSLPLEEMKRIVENNISYQTYISGTAKNLGIPEEFRKMYEQAFLAYEEYGKTLNEVDQNKIDLFYEVANLAGSARTTLEIDNFIQNHSQLSNKEIAFLLCKKEHLNLLP